MQDFMIEIIHFEENNIIKSSKDSPFLMPYKPSVPRF